MKFLALNFLIVFNLMQWGLMGCNMNSISQDEDRADLVKWIKKNHAPIKTLTPDQELSDLKSLESIVGSARLVCLGESCHDAREHFQAKHRVIEYLVKKMGFTHFFMEECLANAEIVNQYILTGEGNPETLLNGLGNWFIWDTEEVLDLVKWMRRYNQDPKTRKKIRFYGVDMTDPWVAIGNLLTYIKKADEEDSKTWLAPPMDWAVFKALIWSDILSRYAEAPLKKIQAFTGFLEGRIQVFKANKNQYVSRTSHEDYEWILRQLVTIKQAHHMYALGAKDSMEAGGVYREKAMKDNLMWRLNSLKKNHRAILWAHNFHVAKAPLDIQIPNRPHMMGVRPLGQLLEEHLKEDLVSIGFAFSQRSPQGPQAPSGPDLLDGVLAQADSDLFLLDFNPMPQESGAYKWLSRKQRMRGQEGEVRLIPFQAFDALLFVREITKTNPSQLARKRFESMR